jgi:hypothetical protein
MEYPLANMIFHYLRHCVLMERVVWFTTHVKADIWKILISSHICRQGKSNMLLWKSKFTWQKTEVQTRTHLFVGDFVIRIYLKITNSLVKLRFLQYRYVRFLVHGNIYNHNVHISLSTSDQGDSWLTARGIMHTSFIQMLILLSCSRPGKWVGRGGNLALWATSLELCKLALRIFHNRWYESSQLCSQPITG